MIKYKYNHVTFDWFDHFIIDTFLHSDKIKDALKYHQELVNEAVEEVTEFCENHNWLSEIHQFVTGWDDAQMDFWKSQPTAMIEVGCHDIFDIYI